MKLLFDQNISYRIIKKILKIYPNAQQVRKLGLDDISDLQIWEPAKKNNFTIVTFDSDFYDLANLKGHPPKIIWLRTGNTTTNYIAELLMDKVALIKDFVENSENKNIACLEID